MSETKTTTDKITGDAAAKISEYIRVAKNHNADPFGAILSVLAGAIETAFKAGVDSVELPDED